MKKDKLEHIFELQRSYDDYIDKLRNLKRYEDLNEWMEKMVLAMYEELAEIQREIPWKWWKNQTDIDREKILEEFIDFLHFYVSSMLFLGFTADDVYKCYVKKNKINFERQTDGGAYDHRKKKT